MVKDTLRTMNPRTKHIPVLLRWNEIRTIGIKYVINAIEKHREFLYYGGMHWRPAWPFPKIPKCISNIGQHGQDFCIAFFKWILTLSQ